MTASRKIGRVVMHWLLPLMALGIVVSAALFVTGVFSYKIYIIHTGSMTPTIPTRSAVIVHEGPVQVGQVVTFHTQAGVVTHRVVEQRPDGTYITKGDANETVDVGSIRASQIVGPVVAAPRRLGYWIAYFKSPVGLASLIIAIVVIWLLYSLVSEFGERRAPSDQPASGLRAADEAANSRANPCVVAEVNTGQSMQDYALDAVPRRCARYAASKTTSRRAAGDALKSMQDDVCDAVPRRCARYAASKTELSRRAAKPASKSGDGTTATSILLGD